MIKICSKKVDLYGGNQNSHPKYFAKSFVAVENYYFTCIFKLFSNDDDPFSITLPPPLTLDEMESDTNERSCEIPVKKNAGKESKKKGRKAKWSNSLLDDMVNIVVNNEYYKRKLLFTNTKNQKNSEIYSKILSELKERAEKRGEEVPFTFVQLCTKFKKAVGDCKKVILTVKTGTGIKKIEEERGYGKWFSNLISYVKTHSESCNPELSVEPSACSSSSSTPCGSDSSGTPEPPAATTFKRLSIPRTAKKKKIDASEEAIN